MGSKKSGPEEGRPIPSIKTRKMRREGYIVEEVADYSNMSSSFDQVLRGSKRKKSRQGRYLLAHREEVIKELSGRIASGTYTVKDYRERTICEGGKIRRIQVLTMKDRIAVHAVMSVVDRHLKKRFIRTTSASIKNRGMHDLMAYIRRDMCEDPEGTQYCYKFDISKFYESVGQDFVIYCVRRVFKDQKLIAMLENFTRLMPEGISIGLRSSQGLGNLLLSVFLDHYLKDKYGVRHFYRYCDDGVVLGETKAELWKIRDAVHGQMSYKLTGKKMKSFKDLNVSYKPDDGKKRFPGSVVSIRELVNLPIIVKDFETGIKTEQGEDRCIVAIEKNGEACKFFTNSEEMKNILAQVREMPDGFPFETVIKSETFGKGRTKYVFT